MDIAQRHNLLVIEDTAHGIMSTNKGDHSAQ
jgi:dTDP-4-amino-4,6-dideoxygalactose transaminase